MKKNLLYQIYKIYKTQKNIKFYIFRIKHSLLLLLVQGVLVKKDKIIKEKEFIEF